MSRKPEICKLNENTDSETTNKRKRLEISRIEWADDTSQATNHKVLNQGCQKFLLSWIQKLISSLLYSIQTFCSVLIILSALF